MNTSTLRISAFSISWLRAYDFGLEQEALTSALLKLRDQPHPLMDDLVELGKPGEIDEIDAVLFDVRYLNDTKLVRIALRPFQLVAQEVGTQRQLTTDVRVNLLLDGGSGFGVFNVSMSHPVSEEDDPFSIEEITCLTRQWLLVKDPEGQPLRLNVRLPDSNKDEVLYLREVMNYYFLQFHDSLWRASEAEYDSEAVDQNWYLERCHEDARLGCQYLRDLRASKRIQSLFPSSFGPVLNIWGMQGLASTQFSGRSFCRDYARELSWLFTDGRNTDLSGRIRKLENEERRASRALFVWPNHAIYINQSPAHLEKARVVDRTKKYGPIDIEIVRIFEVLTLQGAMLHEFDSRLDEMLQKVYLGVANNPESKDIQEVIGQRRRITRAIRTFDYFNLFHGGAQLEYLYRRLLDNSSLEYNAATDLVEAKARRLDEEIDQSVIIQDRIIQQQQDAQQLDFLGKIRDLTAANEKQLEGIRHLTATNEKQSNALAYINILVSATAAFGLTEVLSPLLSHLFSTNTSDPFPVDKPWHWVGLNIFIFILIAVVLRAWFLRGIRSVDSLREADKKTR